MNYSDFRSLVNNMRYLQKQYFRTRSQGDLLESQQLEREVDKALREYDEGQRSFIGEVWKALVSDVEVPA